MSRNQKAQTVGIGNPDHAHESLDIYIEWMVRLLASNGLEKPQKDYYACELLSAHSATCQPLVKPPSVPWGLKKQCFRNAFNLACENSELTYVEGYAVYMLPIHHAWVVDQEGNVIDNTWDELGTAYRGVPFTLASVARAAVKAKCYSILFNPALGKTKHTAVDWRCLQKLRDRQLQLIAQDI